MVNILVVEDDENLNKSICLFLEQKGFNMFKIVNSLNENVAPSISKCNIILRCKHNKNLMSISVG